MLSHFWIGWNLKHIIINEVADVSQVVLFICYEIWRIRNKRCSEGIEIRSASECYKSAIKAVCNYNSAQNDLLQSQNQSVPIPASNIRWCLPSAGSYKMNVDAAGPSDDGKWGLAVVIRDVQGFVSATGCWCLPILPNSDVAEAMAMLKGRKFAKELLFLNIQAESDSSNVIMQSKTSTLYQFTWKH